jgi:hypothetical protein
MKRAIVGYRLDEHQDWVAELECGHGQHVRHRPPFHMRPWTLTAEGRKERLGTMLNCVICDHTEPAQTHEKDDETALQGRLGT